MVINALGSSFMNAELAVSTSWFCLAYSFLLSHSLGRVKGTFRQLKKKVLPLIFKICFIEEKYSFRKNIIGFVSIFN